LKRLKLIVFKLLLKSVKQIKRIANGKTDVND